MHKPEMEAAFATMATLAAKLVEFGQMFKVCQASVAGAVRPVETAGAKENHSGNGPLPPSASPEERAGG